MTCSSLALPTGPSFLSRIEADSGQPVSSCFKCVKCSCGCLLADSMDYLPHQVLEMVQLGLEREVLSSAAIWVCSNCEACAVRCPNKIAIGEVMTACRRMTTAQKASVGENNIRAFHAAFIKSIGKRGRLSETILVLRYKLATRQFHQDLALGIEMLRRGKLPLFPTIARRRVSDGGLSRTMKGTKQS